MNPGSFGGRAPKNAQHLFVHSFTKLNLTNVYATYAEPKQLGAQHATVLIDVRLRAKMLESFCLISARVGFRVALCHVS
jgi:hypothetical protein